MSQTFTFTPEMHGHLTPYFAALHAQCISSDHMPGHFVPPVSVEKLLPWWRERIAETSTGKRLIVLLLAPDAHPRAKPLGTQLRGLAMLRLCDSETGAFRGEVDCVLVQKVHRRQGGAKLLMDALEYEAASLGRTLLLVDVQTSSPAEQAFRKFGYQEIGKVPGYSQVTNEKKGQTFFYKDLLS